MKTDSALLDILGRFLEAGGMIAEPLNEGDTWQLGWSASYSYAISSEGKTLREAIDGVTEAEILEMQSSKI